MAVELIYPIQEIKENKHELRLILGYNYKGSLGQPIFDYE